MHPVARSGFGSDAERYESGRPGYPQAAVDWLVEQLGIDETSHVVDVGAGTGKFTRLLKPTGCRITAVEPLPAMSDVLSRIDPSIEVIEATARDLPISDAAVDAVTSAQALHWFDTADVWTEFARVLVPGGGVGLIWNARDRSVEWVDRVWSIMDDVEKRAPWRNHDRPSGFAFGGARNLFGAIRQAQYHHDVIVTPETMVDRVASVSHVAVLPEDRRRTVLDRVRAVLPDASELTVGYRTDVYAVERR